ncbi:chemotaxis protein CheY [Bowmanella sp. JS7-9]|nr:chemotaxis protein CheY [Bowmanella sp. JS7-9]
MHQGKHILIVDDSSSVRQMVKMTLASTGLAITEASNGQEALELLDGHKFHLIISDVNMPIMDGITLLQQLRQREDYQYTPVLMLTTETNPDLQAQAREYGVKAWLNKPLRPPVLQGAINKLI